MTTKEKQAEKEYALNYLHEQLKPGDTIYTVLRHVSKSGMSRSIQLLISRKSSLIDITWYAARALDDKIDQNYGGIKIGGCGMDMGFALVYNLSRKMFPNGYQCAGEGCPANDHHNHPYPDRDGKMHHADGGYALNQRWI